ncbi:hypothetical protein PV646_15215 [Streptomyces sp. ID05-26A]|nr:hypothetical protein [Streptomyces sp. ID05-26A]
MTRVVCQAVRWVDGLVEVRLADARGAVWNAVGEPAVFDHRGWLGLDVELPFDIEVPCEVVAVADDLVTISGPLGEVVVTPYQLRGGGVVAREAGFYESADEVRAAMTVGEQPWEQDALRYLEQGSMVMVPMAWATDLIDGRSVNERGEWTDGVWFWSGTLVHYLRRYHVVLPDEFLAHMAANGWQVPRMTDDEALAAACLRHPFLADDVAAPVAEA